MLELRSVDKTLSTRVIFTSPLFTALQQLSYLSLCLLHFFNVNSYYFNYVGNILKLWFITDSAYECLQLTYCTTMYPILLRYLSMVNNNILFGQYSSTSSHLSQSFTWHSLSSNPCVNQLVSARSKQLFSGSNNNNILFRTGRGLLVAGERLEERRFRIWKHFWGGRKMVMGGGSEAVGQLEWVKNVFYLCYFILQYWHNYIVFLLYYRLSNVMYVSYNHA